MTDLNHVQLRARDLARSQEFYARWFEFRPHVLQADGVQFLRNDEGFDLALAPHPEPDAFPPWFHLGFRLGSADDVRAAYASMDTAGVPMRVPLTEEPSLVFFRCLDPDGHLLELYWE